MLHPDWIANNIDQITTLYSDLHTDILKSIARHVRDTLETTGKIGLMPSLVTQIEHAQAAGLLRADIMAHIAAALRTNIGLIHSLFEAAGVETIYHDNQVYREAGLPDVVVNQSPGLNKILEAGINKQMGHIQRLTGTIAVNSEALFERTLNTAYNKVVSGTHSYTQALSEGVKDLLNEGVTTFDYASGRKISVEAALLMNIRTGVAQTAGEISHKAMMDRNAPCCETSAHIGARNKGDEFRNHESWQGRVFSLRGQLDGYDGFVSSCGYGHVQGIYGANCRHSHRPFYPGITEQRWTPEKLKEYAEKEYTFTGADDKPKTVGAYHASQIMRDNERQIRAWKRRIELKKTIGEDVKDDKKKLAYWMARQKRFIEETGLRRQPFREKV
jgi:hypothetical protein